MELILPDLAAKKSVVLRRYFRKLSNDFEFLLSQYSAGRHIAKESVFAGPFWSNWADCQSSFAVPAAAEGFGEAAPPSWSQKLKTPGDESDFWAQKNWRYSWTVSAPIASTKAGSTSDRSSFCPNAIAKWTGRRGDFSGSVHSWPFDNRVFSKKSLNFLKLINIHNHGY